MKETIQQMRIEIEPIEYSHMLRLRFRITTNAKDEVCYDKLFDRNDFKSYFRFMAEEGLRKIEEHMFTDVGLNP